MNTPVAAQPDGSDLVWQGSSGLGAQFSAEDRDRLSSAGRNEFLAGIALATAAAALIALVQELPRRARHDGKPQAGAFAAQSRSEETQSRSVERGSTRFEVAAAILLALLAVIRWRRLSSK